MKTKQVTVLGSTGSIGTQSLDVIRAQGYGVFGLAAHSNAALLARQIEEFHPRAVALVDEAAAEQLARTLQGMPCAPVLLRGREGLRELASTQGADIVLNAVVGIAGLAATLAAIESGHDVALANKESLVTGGSLVMEDLSMPAGCIRGKKPAKNIADCLRRALFWQNTRRACRCNKKGCAAAPELEHGK